DGRELFARGDIEAGQNVWQAMGGMEVGSIWGHGSYVAPDWTADYLHREAIFVLDRYAQREWGASYASLTLEQKAALRERLKNSFRRNRYREQNQELVVNPERAEAFFANLDHYTSIFREGRREYAIPAGAQTDAKKLRQLVSFFFWTAWAASTERPGETVSYTNNWPHEPLLGNRVTGDAVVWTGVSIIALLAGIT